MRVKVRQRRRVFLEGRKYIQGDVFEYPDGPSLDHLIREGALEPHPVATPKAKLPKGDKSSAKDE